MTDDEQTASDAQTEDLRLARIEVIRLEGVTQQLIDIVSSRAAVEGRVAGTEVAVDMVAESRLYLHEDSRRRRRRAASLLVLGVICGAIVSDIHLHRHLDTAGVEVGARWPLLPPQGFVGFPVGVTFVVLGLSLCAWLAWTGRERG